MIDLINPPDKVVEPRKTVKIQVSKCGDEEVLPVLSYNELSIFPIRFLLKQKPPGLSQDSDNGYSIIFTTNSVPKNCGFKVGVYAVLNSDFLQVLNEKPHVPNKVEAKVLRQNPRPNN